MFLSMLIVKYWLYDVTFIDWLSLRWQNCLCLWEFNPAVSVLSCFSLPSFGLLVAEVFLLKQCGGDAVLYCDIFSLHVLFQLNFIHAGCHYSALHLLIFRKKAKNIPIFSAAEDFLFLRNDQTCSHAFIWHHIYMHLTHSNKRCSTGLGLIQ